MNEDRIGKLFFQGMLWVTLVGTILMSGTSVPLRVLYNYISGKILFIEIGCIILIILASILAWGKWIVFIKHSRILQILFIYLGVITLASLVGFDLPLSFYGHIERGTGVWFLWLVTGGAMSAMILAASFHKIREMILYALTALGAIIGISAWIGPSGLSIGSFVSLGNASGGGGFMGNSSFAGSVLVLTFFVGLYLLMTARSRSEKIGLGITIFFTIVNPIIFTLPFLKPLAGSLFGIIGDARGATISLIVGIGASLLAFLMTREKTARIGKILLASTIGIVFMMQLLILVPKTPIANFLESYSGGARFIYWNMSFQSFKEHPLLGTGLETFRYAHEKFFDPELLKMGEPWADKPHSVYWEILVTSGIVGLGAYLALMAILIRTLWLSDKRPLMVAGLGLIVAYNLNNTIIFDTMTSYFVFFFMTVWIAYETLTPSAQSLVIEESSLTTTSKVLRFWFIIIVAISGFVITGGIARKAYLSWKELSSPLPARISRYTITEQTSPYGSGITWGQRADSYAQSLLRDEKIPNNIAVADINALTTQTFETLNTYRPNIQLYIAIGNLADAYMKRTGADPIWIERLAMAGTEIKKLSPAHPYSNWFLGRAQMYYKELQKK